MSAWSGIAIVAIAIGVVVVAIGQPVWEWHLSDSTQTETWSYGFFGVTDTVQNDTSGTTTVQPYAFGDLPNQGHVASLFLTLEYLFLGTVAATITACALCVASLQKKLRGLFAAIAFVGGCLLALAAAVYPFIELPTAAADLPRVGGHPITTFEGQITQGGASTTILSWGPSLSWYLVLGIALVLAYGASEMWSLRPARKPVLEAAPAAEPDIPPPPPELPAPGHMEPQIEEVFVIGGNGLLIKHMSRTLMTDKDRDVVGGMILVVSNFVRESFSERDGSDVEEVSLGNHRFILCNEKGVVVAVLATRGSKEDIEPRLRHLAACLLDRYGEKLDRWDGQRLEGIEDEIAILWEPFFVPPPPAD